MPSRLISGCRAAAPTPSKRLAGKSSTRSCGGCSRRNSNGSRIKGAIKALNTMWEGEMLDPKMKNDLSRPGARTSNSRWNDTPPAEVDEGVRLNANTGEKIDLFGDDFPGIDGTIGNPPRPLQLKAVPASEDIENIPRVAGDALKKARAHGFSRVEVSIEAPGRTVAEVRPRSKPTRPLHRQLGVGRVRVWCTDGVFEPTSFRHRRRRPIPASTQTRRRARRRTSTGRRHVRRLSGQQVFATARPVTLRVR